MSDDNRGNDPFRFTHRAAISAALAAAGGAQALGQVTAVPSTAGTAVEVAPRYDMGKSINLWAFPYPDKMSLEQCLQLAHDAGFEAIELNYDLDNDLSPKSSTKEFHAIRKLAERIGISISGVCSFLFWPYPMTSNDPQIRIRSRELAGKMISAAHDLGTDNLLVVPGAVTIPWRTDYEPVPNDLCEERAIEAVRAVLPQAEKLGVNLNIENIFFNGFLMTPDEMVDFVDSFASERVRIHFDTGNIMLFQYPEHWIRILGNEYKTYISRNSRRRGRTIRWNRSGRCWMAQRIGPPCSTHFKRQATEGT